MTPLINPYSIDQKFELDKLDGVCPRLNRLEYNFGHWETANSRVIKSFWLDLYLVGERLIEFEFDVGVCYSLKVKVTLFFLSFENIQPVYGNSQTNTTLRIVSFDGSPVPRASSVVSQSFDCYFI